MTAVKRRSDMRQLESMFGGLGLAGRRSPRVTSVVEPDPHCDVHGRRSPSHHRSSLYLHSRESTPGHYRDSVSPVNGLIIRRRESLGSPGPRELEHPASFPSLLRAPRRETPSPTPRCPSSRHSMGSYPALARQLGYSCVSYSRPDSALSSCSVRDMKRDYVGSMSSLSRKSSVDTRKSSSDSLDHWQPLSWDSDHTTSPSSPKTFEPLIYGYKSADERSAAAGNPGDTMTA
ncbi:unnamed protein product [Plutella xylostella]|uniref:(diamondback moth) hypothetical protein n=1 Tax=Plutella xylostella TaxID=51655 RepID=A0A8S4GFC1_PLUXY|nr:unnamed protein product [Plutella xylostella]